MKHTNERAAPSPKNAASNTNTRNHTTATGRGARARKHLTREQRGQFWQTVGDLIEQAAGRAAK